MPNRVFNIYSVCPLLTSSVSSAGDEEFEEPSFDKTILIAIYW